LNEATQLLRSLRDGSPVAAEQLLPVVYRELRALAGSSFKNQQANQTLQPTALLDLPTLDGRVVGIAFTPLEHVELDRTNDGSTRSE